MKKKKKARPLTRTLVQSPEGGGRERPEVRGAPLSNRSPRDD